MEKVELKFKEEEEGKGEVERQVYILGKYSPSPLIDCCLEKANEK